MFAGNLLNWPSGRTRAEISAANVSAQVFAVKPCRQSKLDCPPKAQLLSILLEFGAKKLNKWQRRAPPPGTLGRKQRGRENMQRPIDNCYWVVPGRFLAGEYPASILQDGDPWEKASALAAAGVSVFVDLTEVGELRPYAHKIGAAKHLRFPIRDHSVPKSDQRIRDALDAIDNHLDGSDIVYVHCWGGIGRTGLIVGCWLARHGLAGDQALTRLDELWQSCPKSRYMESPETHAQKAAVRNWRSGM